jgi:protein phosphatase
VGLRRQQNEDYLGVKQTPNGLLIVVCDGMGGHRGGERASALAVEAMLKHVAEGRGSAEALLREGSQLANDAIVREAASHPELEGMGTTLVAAILRGPGATIINVGDSRAYLQRGDSLKPISTDHSLVAEMVARGEITREEAAHHPRRNIITRALGSQAGVEPDLFHIELEREDVILLATDGLHGMIDDNAIRDVLTLIPDPARACDELVERALSAGGVDNVSVIIARYGEGGDNPEPATDPGTMEEIPARRGPRGLAMIVGIGLGAIIFMCLLVAFWFYALSPDIDHDMSRRDSSAVAHDSAADAAGVRYDSSGTRDTIYNSLAPPQDSIRPGDTIDW